jgi:hypothetical protein
MRVCVRLTISPRRLYRGILPPLMLEAPKRAIKCESWFRTYPPSLPASVEEAP